MNVFTSKHHVKIMGALAIFLLFGLSVQVALAHRSGGYSHDSTIGTSNPDWMGSLPDNLRISELSIPGTHDTMSLHGHAAGDIAICQSMSLSDQLHSGIRALDIRCRHIDDKFAIHHGEIFQHVWFNDVLNTVNAFLDAHPTEVILMRVKEEYNPEGNTRTFEETFKWYKDSHGSHVWQPTGDNNPRLGDVRGKIIILDNFSGTHKYGLHYTDFDIQDKADLCHFHELYGKWEAVKAHLNKARSGAEINEIYVNYLSGAPPDEQACEVVWPYFVASGHSSPGTGDPRRATGLVDPWDCDGCWPDFPRLSCVGSVCSVYYEGTNELTLNYLNNAGSVKKRTGIIMSDFPGAGLITKVIGLNPWNYPPIAKAGGPYIGDEGSEILFDASASYDQDNDALRYRWDFNGDGLWDSYWSPDPTATHQWNDDWVGTAIVEVDDQRHPTPITATVSVTVNNVNPVASIDSITDDTGQSIEYGIHAGLVGHELNLAGSFTDKGILDTHVARIDWGDGVIDELGSTAGAITAAHIYNKPGDYTALLTVTDDDNGVGTAKFRLQVDYLLDPDNLGPEWSPNTGKTTPPCGTDFLGEFGNETVTFSLAGLTAHTLATVDFDLFIIRSWNGSQVLWPPTSNFKVEPDIWGLNADGKELLRTTFSNWLEHRQAYPGWYPGGDYPRFTGAAEKYSLCYTSAEKSMDATYKLSFTFPHTGASLKLDFYAQGLEVLSNESWGLGGVKVILMNATHTLYLPLTIR